MQRIAASHRRGGSRPAGAIRTETGGHGHAAAFVGRMTPVRTPARSLCRRVPLLALVLCACLGRSAGEARAEDPHPADVAVHPTLAPLRPWLRHDDWTVRSIAAFELRRRSEGGAVLLATRMLAREEHPYAAACALAALRGRPRQDLVLEGGPALVEVLLRLAAHEHPTVSAYAQEVLRGLPSVRLGNDLAVYAGWWARARDSFERERSALQAAAAAALAKVRDADRPSSTSVAPERDDRFYGRLELMRKHGLELCIVMDHTGSMGHVIGAAKRRAVALLTRLRAYVPQFRAGLVTYDDAARLRIPLTQDGALLQKAFRKVGAGGGGDWEEGVDKGIRLALRQERLGWSQRACRVIVVIGDAPPHDGDLPGLLRALQRARSDEMYDWPVVVHTVSTSALPVLHFPKIALAGGGQHVTLTDTGALLEELVLLTFGGADRDRVKAWMQVIDALRAAEAPERAGHR